MKINLLFFLILFSCSVSGQNLVPNPDFETYNNIPCSWIGTPADLADILPNWMIQSGSPDVFSTLSSNDCFANAIQTTEYYSPGKQQPHSGDFMGGIITYGAGMGSYSQYRESYEIKLSTPLTVGQTYYAEFYVSLAEQSEFASNNISLYFSVPLIPFNLNDWGPLHVTPQISETSIVADTTGWTKISGTFIADSPAEYLVIGNFTDDNLTQVTHMKSNTSFANAYYFIDDLLVKETCLAVSSNQTICQNESATISASSDSFHGWALSTNPGTIISTDSIFLVTPLSTTTYLALSDCDTFSVTVNVQTLPPDLFLGNDTTICEGTVLILKATDPNGSYTWQDGSIKPYFDVDTSGTYSLIETNQCGTSVSEIQVNFSPLPVIPFENLTYLCEGASIFLNEYEPTLQAEYVNSTGTMMLTTKVISDPGMYTLIAQNSCGYSSKQIIVKMKDCAYGIEMPNIITPNGDNINDLFTPVFSKGILEMQTRIFNRWGELIYETSNPAIEWNGISYAEGVYFWQIVYTDINSNENTQQGFVQVIK